YLADDARFSFAYAGPVHVRNDVRNHLEQDRCQQKKTKQSYALGSKRPGTVATWRAKHPFLQPITHGLSSPPFSAQEAPACWSLFARSEPAFRTFTSPLRMLLPTTIR